MILDNEKVVIGSNVKVFFDGDVDNYVYGIVSRITSYGFDLTDGMDRVIKVYERDDMIVVDKSQL